MRCSFACTRYHVGWSGIMESTCLGKDVVPCCVFHVLKQWHTHDRQKEITHERACVRAPCACVFLKLYTRSWRWWKPTELAESPTLTESVLHVIQNWSKSRKYKIAAVGHSPRGTKSTAMFYCQFYTKIESSIIQAVNQTKLANGLPSKARNRCQCWNMILWCCTQCLTFARRVQ